MELDEDYVLTFDVPVVAFEVTYCLDEPPTKSLQVYGSFGLVAQAEGAHDVLIERLDPVDEDLDTTSTVEVEGGDWRTAGGLRIQKSQDWSEGGRRCSEPVVVQVSVDGLAEGETVSIEEVSARVSGDFFTGLCEDRLDDNSFSVRLVPL